MHMGLAAGSNHHSLQHSLPGLHCTSHVTVAPKVSAISSEVTVTARLGLCWLASDQVLLPQPAVLPKGAVSMHMHAAGAARRVQYWFWL
jgi:hypothetical protein